MLVASRWIGGEAVLVRPTTGAAGACQNCGFYFLRLDTHLRHAKERGSCFIPWPVSDESRRRDREKRRTWFRQYARARRAFGDGTDAPNCACGCGEPVMSSQNGVWSVWRRGHHVRGRFAA